MKTLSAFIFLLLIFPPSLQALEEQALHVQGQLSSSRTWMDFTSDAEVNLKKLFELLGRSAEGKKLLQSATLKARASGLTILDVVKVGESSLTDTTLVRKFSRENPEAVSFETKSTVYINRHLAWDDALLDLAHELTHYVRRDSFNPYGEHFNPTDFIKSTIEGKGGEVEAFITECKVLRELFSANVQTRSHCQKIQGSQGELSFERAVKLFYHVGDYYEKFHGLLEKRKLSQSFELLKPEKINFISSAYGVPYPMAALMEYDLVVNKVCENDRKRLAYMQQAPGRAPASTSSTQEQFLRRFASRCGSGND